MTYQKTIPTFFLVARKIVEGVSEKFTWVGEGRLALGSAPEHFSAVHIQFTANSEYISLHRKLHVQNIVLMRMIRVQEVTRRCVSSEDCVHVCVNMNFWIQRGGLSPPAPPSDPPAPPSDPPAPPSDPTRRLKHGTIGRGYASCFVPQGDNALLQKFARPSHLP